MKLTFIGQQSWAVETESSFVLVDPVLGEWFGTSHRQKFIISPRRRVISEKMPLVSAVIITNEHLDHFNLPSLMRLPPGTPVYLGDLMPQVCVNALKQIGLAVNIVKDQELIHLGDIDVRLYLSAPESAAWEKRVYHALFSKPDESLSVLIQSDGLISADLIEDIEKERIPPIGLFIATNNAQVVPPGATGTYHNLLPLAPEPNDGVFGIRIFHQILCEIPDPLGYIPHLTYCGGGYIQDPPKHGNFVLTETRLIEETFQTLALGQTLHCLAPGESLLLTVAPAGIACIKSTEAWIIPASLSDCDADSQNMTVQNEWFNRSIFGNFESEHERSTALQNVERELFCLAPVFLLSALGRRASATSHYLDGPVGKHRLAIRFYEQPVGHVLTAALNFTTCEFEWIKLEEAEVLTSIPFGFDVYTKDFSELLKGGIQIWELASARMRQWHLSHDALESPIAFLYTYFSEQVRTELANRMYQKIILGNKTSHDDVPGKNGGSYV